MATRASPRLTPISRADFLAHVGKAIELPPVDGATANPVTLFYLERDIREMERLTKGKAAYFRKRIRMALYQGAQVRDVRFSYRGQTVPVFYDAAGKTLANKPMTGSPPVRIAE